MSEIPKTDRDTLSAHVDEVFAQLDSKDPSILVLRDKSWSEAGQLGLTRRLHRGDYARRQLGARAVAVSRDIITPSVLGVKMLPYRRTIVDIFPSQFSGGESTRWSMEANGDIVNSNPQTNEEGRTIIADSPEYATTSASIREALIDFSQDWTRPHEI
jgi:hypothetical protein